ncbi:FCD domain-containing protein [Romeria aff. gracilis LEGE 07310]|uniref:FCD domain-containing protein n=1 Tax=Vasconcelosia minhoensis LEGE 07310 TaxID=915328 RepID=A0A8J7ARB9_9CYAN|nr:FCD domain-containing protein [Romeria aff. gracilis LEGE 07310]
MSDTSFAPQRAKTLHDQTYLALRSAILFGRIRVGERLVETQLAQQFQVSRTPIRAAVCQLQQTGLLTAHADGGIYVRKLSLHDAIKIYDCRIVLEQLAVAGSCEHATKAQLKAIEQTLIESELIAQRGDAHSHSIQLLDLNIRFHRLIAQSSDNPWLVPLLEQLSNQATLSRVQTLQATPDVFNVHHEHRQIYTAIANHDADMAVQQLTHHLQSSQKRIAKQFQAGRADASQSAGQMQTSQRCPECGSPEISKNGRRSGRQNYICKQCRRQFLERLPG